MCDFVSRFTPPQGVDPFDIFKQVFVDIGLEDLVDRIELAKEEGLVAVDKASKGDWEPAKKFASDHRGLIIGVDMAALDDSENVRLGRENVGF